MKWTESQLAAITGHGKDMLVSASAGSGKTTIMIERIAGMIKSGQVTPEEILVLTFTNATAGDMRSRLRRTLHEFDLSTASIGTFHKFCSDLVRTYFNLVGLDPAFDVLDESLTRQIQHEILDELLSKNLHSIKDAVFTFCVNRSTTTIKDLCIDIYNFLSTREDPLGWLDRVALCSYNPAPNPSHKKISEYKTAQDNYYKAKFTGFLMTAKSERATKILPFITDCLENKNFPRLVPDKNFSEYIEFKDTRDEYKKDLARLECSASLDQDKRIVEQMVFLVKKFILAFTDEKQKRESLDFADMERFALQILENQEVQKTIREKFKFVFVDEYQDTSPLQEKILSLVGKPKSIFMVGDVKQSIYGFRGCEVTIFANKLTDYELNLSGLVVRLNENFRSNPTILSFVNKVFEKIMPDYVGFDIKDTKDTAVEVILTSSNITQQCGVLAQRIHALTKQGVRLGDIAILARSSTHFATLSEVLKTAHIQSELVATKKATDIPGVNMLLDFLFAVANPLNELPLVKTMLCPVFNFSNDDVAKMRLVGKWDPGFLETLARFRLFSKTHSVAEVLEKFLSEFMIYDKHINTFIQKIKNLPAATNLTRFLYLIEHGLLDIDVDLGASSRESVKIMTIHKSKGLEFKNVFLFDTGSRFPNVDSRKFLVIDKECGLCVFGTDLDEWIKSPTTARLGALISGEQTQIEEEKRLLYVALTRAKERLFIVGSRGLQMGRVAKNYFHFMEHAITDVLDETKTQVSFMEQAIKTLPNNASDKNIVKQLKETFKKAEQRIPGSDVVLKTSVTSLTQKEAQFLDHSPVLKSPNADRGLEYGNFFHNTMQRIDFDNPKSDDQNILRAVKTVKEFTKGMKILREVPFLKKANKDGVEILVQGIIDLLAINDDGAVLIDYKTTRASKDRLTELYRDQLGIYQSAVKEALGLENIKSYIYSTSLDSLIHIE